MTARGVVIFSVFFFLGFVAVVVTVLAVDALVVASRRGGIAAGCSVLLEDRGLRGFSIRGEEDSSISRRIRRGFCATSSVPLAYTTWDGQKDTPPASYGRVYTRMSVGGASRSEAIAPIHAASLNQVMDSTVHGAMCISDGGAL